MRDLGKGSTAERWNQKSMGFPPSLLVASLCGATRLQDVNFIDYVVKIGCVI